MSTRKEIVSSFYGQYDEDGRTARSRHGQLEFCTTMTYIHRYAARQSKILEVGAGTGRYSIALAREGMDVTAVELVENNLAVLRENSKGLENIRSYQGDATDLSRFPDNSFDVTLFFGPMYHLYEEGEVNRAIDEAIRVTKPGGVIMFSFISVFAIIYANYFYGNWAAGQEENFTDDYEVKHFKEQLFTGCVRTFSCRMKILKPLRNGIWLFPKNGSCWEIRTIFCTSVENRNKLRYGAHVYEKGSGITLR